MLRDTGFETHSGARGNVEPEAVGGRAIESSAELACGK